MALGVNASADDVDAEVLAADTIFSVGFCAALTYVVGNIGTDAPSNCEVVSVV